MWPCDWVGRQGGPGFDPEGLLGLLRVLEHAARLAQEAGRRQAPPPDPRKLSARSGTVFGLTVEDHAGKLSKDFSI